MFFLPNALKVFVLVFVVVTNGRESPNANYVRLYMKTEINEVPQDVVEDATLDAPGLIAKYGYPVEVYKITTADGYILEVHRIPYGRNNGQGPRLPVLLFHGLLSSSADYLVTGPGNGLAFVLADAGYDVWLANARGNYYSRHHKTLNPNEKDFWKFSWDEMGNYDLPAIVDFILLRTGQPRIHYVGHSQGTTSFIVMTCLRPEYNEKFISFQAMAPAVFFKHNEQTMVKTLASLENVIEATAFSLNKMEMYANRDLANWFYATYCKDESVLRFLCVGVFADMLTNHSFNHTKVPVILGHTPAGGSIRQVTHFGQLIRFDAFRRYNHNNPVDNIAKYGTMHPPAYNLSLVTVPCYIHYGMSDKQVHYKDVLLLTKSLPNVVKLNKVRRPSFNHFDFLWSQDVVKQLYKTLVSLMRQAEVS